MSYEALSQRLGVSIEPQLLEQSLTHRSYSYEHGGIPNNERLEFLGDSVLGFVVTEHIFQTLTALSEGELTKIKNTVVSEKALDAVARKLGLGEHLLLGRGEELTGGRAKPSILADAVEAILGAILISRGLDEARRFVAAHVFPLLDNPDAIREASDPKTSLIELAQRLGLGVVTYEISFTGPDHDRIFTAQVLVGSNLVAAAEGRTKKTAETAAAIVALQKLRD